LVIAATAGITGTACQYKMAKPGHQIALRQD